MYFKFGMLQPCFTHTNIRLALKSMSCDIFALTGLFLLLHVCDGQDSLNNSDSSINNLTHWVFPRITRRNVDLICTSKKDCNGVLPGSLCLNGSCVCPQGYFPSTGRSNCFEVAKHLGDSCNTSIPCGEDLSCINDVCWCPEGQQYVQMQDANLCLLWRRPTRLVDRCRNIEDCYPLDPNSVCRKRWCHCKSGYQMFETMLFGLKHKCFRTYKRHCHNSSQCFTFGAEIDQHCICQYGYCHCIPNSNSSSSDIHKWANEKPTWYQHWRKDIILATRLLFITIILFFVPCFVYVTLGVREHGRSYFSRSIQPSRNASVQATHTQPRGRAGSLPSRPRALYIPEAHNVEIALGSRGVSTRLVDGQDGSTARVPGDRSSRDRRNSSSSNRASLKEDDPPPSYDDIMRVQRLQDTPPPPYREL